MLAVHRLHYQMAAFSVGQMTKKTTKRSDGDGDGDGAEHRVDAGHGAGAEPDDESSALLNIPLFAPLTDKQREVVRAAMTVKTFSPGERIIAAGEISPGLFIIEHGEVALRLPKALSRVGGNKGGGASNGASSAATPSGSGNGSSSVQRVGDDRDYEEVEWLGPGDNFGEAALLSGGRQIMGVDAVASKDSLQGVRCLMLTGQKFVDIVTWSHGDIPILDLIKHVHLVRLLSRNPIFAKLSSDQITQLAKNVELRPYGSGDTIIIGGRPVSEAGGLFIVTQGVVKLVPDLEAGMDDFDFAHELEEDEAEEAVRNESGAGGNAGEQIIMPQQHPLFQHMATSADENLAGLVKGPDLGPDDYDGDADGGQTGKGFGEADQDYAVLLVGDTFGEDAVLVSNPGDEIVQLSTVFALGSVTCGLITRAALERLGVADLVVQACVEEESGAGMAEVEKRAQLNQESLSSRFMAFEKKIGADVVTGLANTVASGKAVLKMSSARLKVLRRLHHTDLTDVWVAMDQPTQQLIVVKALTVPVAKKRGLGEYVHNEQSILAQLRSPFVVHMLTAWEEHNRVVVGLEPALGGDMETLLKKVMYFSQAHLHAPGSRRSIPALFAGQDQAAAYTRVAGELGGVSFDHARFVAACATLALKHLFEHNVVHRDLKPGNLILDHHGYVKLVDFGISKQLPSALSRTNTLCGTPKYMSPELSKVAYGRSPGYTCANDWWALGVLLYEIVIGLTPFERDVSIFVDAAKKGTKVRRSSAASKGETPAPADSAAAPANASAGYQTIFGNIAKFTERAGGSADPVFAPLVEVSKQKKLKKWDLYADFVSRLLLSDPLKRLGCGETGPREAMSHPLFGGSKDHGVAAIDWDRMHRRGVVPPYTPRLQDLLVDIDDVAKISKEVEEQYQEAQMRAKESSDPAEMDLMGPNGDEMGFFGAHKAKGERARRQMLMARQQQLRRVAYKGLRANSNKDAKATDELDEVASSRRKLALLVLQRATTSADGGDSRGSVRIRSKAIPEGAVSKGRSVRGETNPIAVAVKGGEAAVHAVSHTMGAVSHTFEAVQSAITAVPGSRSTAASTADQEARLQRALTQAKEHAGTEAT